MNTHRLINRTFVAFALIATNLYCYAKSNEEWPREIVSGKTIITLYQPDVESLTNNKMEARAAVSVVTNENPTPVFGAVWLNCRISTDMDERTVELLNVNVESAKFPDIDESKVQQYSSILEREIPQWELTMSLDELLASMEYSENSEGNDEQFNNTPPEIIFSTTPTALILIDGEPNFKKLENSEYEYVVNTPFFIVKHNRTGRLYLKGGNFWYSSTDINRGWGTILSPPANLEEIAEQAMKNDEEEQDDFDSEYSNVAPELIISTTPAELIQSNGVPEYSSVENTSLLYMTNTDDDIIMDINNQEYYTLISGRWYKTRSLNSNNWAFVAPDELPEDFARIPENAEIANVRSSVYGTTEARESVLENQIPQTATIDRNEARVDVTYDGNPRFEEIRGTTMLYAVNTDKSVIFIQGRYYCCDNAVWFEALSPAGPWIVSTYIPEDIRRIPPEYPVYNVKYVYIYDYTPEVVYVGYTPGYRHCYTYRGCVYYGTGYYYKPWYGYYYYPRPYTYGFRVRYNPYTGWGFTYGAVYGGPYHWMGFGWHSHHYAYWGPTGYRYSHPYHYYNDYNHAYKRGYYHGYADGHHSSYNNYSYRTNNVYGNRRSTSGNVYQYRSNGVNRTGSSTYNSRTGERVSVNQTNSRQARVSTTSRNDVYTDRSGNVYRRNDNGNWQERRSGQWQDQSRNAADTRGQNVNTRERQSDNRNQTQTQTNTRTQTQTSTQNRTQNQGQNQRQSQTQTQTNQQNRQSDNRTYQQSNDRSNNQNLNNKYDSRSRGTQRTQEYQQNRTNTQQTRQNSQQTDQNRSNSRNAQGTYRSSDSKQTNSRSSGKASTGNTDKSKNSSGNTKSSGNNNSRNRNR